MNKKNICIGIISILSIVFLCGCNENIKNQDDNNDIDTQNTVNVDKFIGTWTGNMEISMFGGMQENYTSYATGLKFTKNTVEMTINNIPSNNDTQLNETTQTITYTYTADENNIYLQPQFNRNRSNMRELPEDMNNSFENGESPPFDGEQPPYDGEQPPFDEKDFPFDGEQPPFNGERPTDSERPSSMTISYSYNFNENNTLLYLDGNSFNKI